MANLPVIDLAIPRLKPEEEPSGSFSPLGLFPCDQPRHLGSSPSEMKTAMKALFHLHHVIKHHNSDVIHGSEYVGPTSKNLLMRCFGFMMLLL
jgi:hypothetical protein